MINLILFPFKILLYFLKLLLFPFNFLLKSNNDNNIWNLSNEDKRIAKSEHMSDADYIEAEERDDDNLDDDD